MPGVSDGTQHGQPTPPAATWQPNKDEQADLAALDVALSRMRERLPADPYIMTIPQEPLNKYSHHYQVQAAQWTYNSPFDFRREHESIQYLTYHYYEPGNSDMYEQHNSRHVGEQAANASAAAKMRQGTGAKTPSTGPKRKITLGAYTKKQNGEAVTPEQEVAKAGDAATKQPAVKGPVEKLKAETQELLAAVAEDSEAEQKMKMKKDKSPEHGDLKRKRGDLEKRGQAISRSLEPAPKKLRTEEPQKPPAASAHQETPPKTKVRTTEEDEASLPPRLSPGMPPRLSPTVLDKLSPLHKEDANPSLKTLPKVGEPALPDESKLPPRLSPTLPDNIAKSLQARAHLRSASQSSNPSAPSSVTKDKNGMLTPMKRPDGGVTKHKSPAPRNGFRATSSSPAVRSDVEERGNLPATPVARVKSPVSSREDDIAVGRSFRPQQPAEAQKSSLLVKLKYKRARREDIQRILRMRPTADKRMSEPLAIEKSGPAKPADRRNGERREDPAVKTKGVAQKIGPAKKEKRPSVDEKLTEKPSVAERRTLPDDERHESAAKRVKRTEESSNRKEPSTPAPKEVDSPLAPKSQQHITPSTRKDLLSAAMKREHSQDSNATHTPPALTSTPSMNNSQSNGASKPPSSQPSNKSPKQQAWETEQKKLETLGRELKHAAQAEGDQKLAAVKSLESFLCYILAFGCADEAALTADPKQFPSYRNWRTLIGFFGFVKRNTEAFASLSGLACAFGVVFTSRILEISTQVTEGPSRDTLIDTQALLQRSAAAVEEKLDIDTLQDTFPRAWKERTRKFSSHDKLDPAKLGGQYRLPIGLATPPIRAARAGHAMLLEWIQKEKINYTLKLKL